MAEQGVKTISMGPVPFWSCFSIVYIYYYIDFEKMRKPDPGGGEGRAMLHICFIQ